MEKLVWNAAFNPLSLIFECNDTTELLSNSERIVRIRHIMGEVIQLAKADGCDLDPDLIEIKLKQTQSMAPYKTSMLRDFEESREIELDVILNRQFAQKKVLVYTIFGSSI